MANLGVAPPDLGTNVGKLRMIIGDINYTPIEDGVGDYEGYSDDQLESFLSLGGDNLSYGAGYAYLALAAQFAADSIKITTDDESVDLTARAESMRKLANEWFNRGDEMLSRLDADSFSIVYPEFSNDKSNWPAELETPDVEWWS